jgi:hypothetical protein
MWASQGVSCKNGCPDKADKKTTLQERGIKWYGKSAMYKES